MLCLADAPLPEAPPSVPSIFGRQDFITYVDLAEQIQAILDVKERTAKSYIKFMREKEIIRKDPSNQSYYIIGNLKQAGL